MCGINGFNFESKELIDSMNKSIAHRGPDGQGILIDQVSLGHRRLSIIDLSERGKQPMSNETGDIWITFNGEIYNFQEIKSQLEKNHKFKSNTDTEVIIHAYEEWGQECVNKFNGMWAFCIYDRKKNLLFLSRDRFGKKPLYYYSDGRKFIFSSEIKGILEHGIERKLNKKGISSYLMYRYVLGENTLFEGIKKVMPAHNLIYDLTENKYLVKEYWDIYDNPTTEDEAEAKEAVSSALIDSVIKRKVSDVPLGVILSGGLDSSLITAILAKSEGRPINTFTVKFNEPGFDETHFAKIVSKMYKTNYSEVVLDTSNFLDIMKEYTKYKDEPIGVPNEIALYLLSRKIKENVTVVLSGEGADEAFEGYGRIFSSTRDYKLLKKIEKMENSDEVYRKKFSSLYKKYNGVFFKSELEHFLYLYRYWSKLELDSIVLPEFKSDFSEFFSKYMNKFNNLDYNRKLSYIFLKAHLPGLLNRLDSSTMASAVEARAPFLDKNLVQNAFLLDSKFKTRWILNEDDLYKIDKSSDELSENYNKSKWILKEISKNYLPGEIIERKKQGFPLPLNNWFKGEFLEIAQKLILDQNSKLSEILNKAGLKLWIRENKDSELFGQKLWMLVCLELWLREWFQSK